ncbi:MAG: putative Arylsulfatase [Promethearchaeota archaeon]|nr:MAG: putative Arylsulfatase [Candidatus Lokiarchaeota archaeon]
MSKKRNVLFIMCDALRWDHLGCMGNKTVKTPNIDRLADQGVKFTNYFCTNPICMPNRATLETGVYPNVHGVRSNGINMDEHIPTMIKSLRRRGWHTAAIGKIHHQYWMAPFKHRYKSYEGLVEWAKEEVTSENFPSPYYGYEEVEVVSGNGSICAGHYLEWLEEKSPNEAEKMKKKVVNYDNLFSLYCDPIPADLYNTTYVKERTIAFLERYANGIYGDKPFYLHCSFPDPHYPLYPPEEYQEMYNPEEIELPPSFNDIERLYNHEYLGPLLENPPFKKAFLRESSEEEVKNITALTYASISYVDFCIGQILAALEKLGYSDNTMVLFSSDHGDLMGDHGLLFKGPCPFNGVLQIPLIWKVPGVSEGSTCDSLVSTIDLPKTILSTLDIRERYHPPDMQGFDITSILTDNDLSIRSSVFIENDEEIGPLESRLRHLITQDYKLTVYETAPEFGDLYDRNNDPNELNNLWDDLSYRDIRCKLLNQCLRENLKAQTKYPKRIAGS